MTQPEKYIIIIIMYVTQMEINFKLMSVQSKMLNYGIAGVVTEQRPKELRKQFVKGLKGKLQ